MKADLDNFAVILHEPRYPENIGAAARCCRNMGIPRLITVRPQLLDQEKMLKMATHEAASLIHDMEVFDSLKEALAPFNFVVGTTARTGRQRQPTHTPRQMAEKLVGLSPKNRIALLFGSEKWGLSNAELCRCHALVTIPTSSFSSINLAQSVMILCYEIFNAGTEASIHQPKLATSREIENMFNHLETVFEAIGLMDKQNPEYWRIKLRRIFGRIELRSREVKFIRGFCRNILRTLERA